METLYEKIRSSTNFLWHCVEVLTEDYFYDELPSEYAITINKQRIANEFDHFFKEFPEQKEKYLNEFFREYSLIFEKIINFLQSEDENIERFKLKTCLFRDLEYLYVHLISHFNLETQNSALSTKSKGRTRKSETDFNNFLSDSTQNKNLFEVLISEYKNKNPEDYFYMIEALIQLGILEKDIKKNISSLHKILNTYFGDCVRSRRYFSNFFKYDYPIDNDKLKQHVVKLTKLTKVPK